MTGDAADLRAEEEWAWNTRITAEAARIALAQGKTPQERFEIYEKIISTAVAARHNSKTCPPQKMFYDDVENIDLSGFEE